MKLQDLFEMPNYINKEMHVLGRSGKLSMSLKTVDDDYVKIGSRKLGSKDYWVLLSKAKTSAVLGVLGSDEEARFEILAQLDLKDKLDLSWEKEIHVQSKNVIQVDGVQVLDDDFKKRGLGSTFYSLLALYGYVLISDTTQYKGGKELWKKLVKTATKDNLKVHVIQDGVPLMDGSESSEALNYNGTNYPDEKIWGAAGAAPEESLKHVLLVLKM